MVCTDTYRKMLHSLLDQIMDQEMPSAIAVISKPGIPGKAPAEQVEIRLRAEYEIRKSITPL